jgi:hypothetical protein
VTPGGGVTDPVDAGETPSRFGTFGGYNPPYGPDTDPIINPGAGAYAMREASASKTVVEHRGVRMESHSGLSAGALPMDGLIGGCTFAPPSGPGRGARNERPGRGELP